MLGVAGGILMIVHLPSAHQHVDVLTNPLQTHAFLFLR